MSAVQVFVGWKPRDMKKEDEEARRSKLYLSINIYDLLEERGVPDGDQNRLESYLPLEVLSHPSPASPQPTKYPTNPHP